MQSLHHYVDTESSWVLIEHKKYKNAIIALQPTMAHLHDNPKGLEW